MRAGQTREHCVSVKQLFHERAGLERVCVWKSRLARSEAISREASGELDCCSELFKLAGGSRLDVIAVLPILEEQGYDSLISKKLHC